MNKNEKMEKMKKYFVFFMAATLIILGGCWDDPSDKGIPPKVRPNVPLEGIELSNTAMEIMVSKKQLIYVTYTPEKASNKTMIWSSSASNIASVDKWGEVTGVKEGTATITAVSEEGGFKIECVVTVVPNVANPVTGIAIDKSELNLAIAQKFTLTATLAPADADIKTVEWTSSNPDVASVSVGGVVAGLKAGVSTITATSVDGGFTATCSVTVNEDYLIADFESYLDEKGIPQNTVGTVLPSAGWNATPQGKVEIALSPKDDPGGPVGLGLVGPEQVLLIYGDVVNATYGNMGSNRVAPQFEVQLPAGKVLGDYTSLSFDAYVYRGKDTGPQDNLGDAESGCGWYGSGVHIKINDVQGGSTNLRTLGEPAYVGPGGEVKGDGSNWPTKTWARGIKIDLSVLADFDTVKTLNSFTLVFGTESGYAVYCIDNVILKK